MMIAAPVFDNNLGVVVDPSGMGADDNVFMAIDEGLPLEWFEKTVMSATEKAYKAIEICKKIDGGSLRFSLGRQTTKADIDYVLKSLYEILEKLKKWYN